MDAVEQSDYDPRLGQADSKNRRAELEGDDRLLLRIVPDDQLVTASDSVAAPAGPGCAHLVLRELGLPSSSDESEVIGLAQHLRHSDARIEVCGEPSGRRQLSSQSQRGDEGRPHTSGDLELTWVGVEDCSSLSSSSAPVSEAGPRTRGGEDAPYRRSRSPGRRRSSCCRG